MLANLKECGIEPFSFAGFNFPKHVWTLPRGDFKTRIKRMRHPITSNYYHAPKPIDGRSHGIGFYLESDGQPFTRWQWANDVVRLDHTGWYSDEYGDGELIRGIVARLPHGRGFLAGWSMGEGMVSEIDGYLYLDEESAAYAADSWAERVAEQCREDAARFQAEEENGKD